MKHQKREIYYGLTLNYKKNKNRNSVKWSKLITQQPKNLENSSIVVIKLGTIEHPKTFRKLSIAIRKAEKFPKLVRQVKILISLCIVKKK